MTAAPLAPSNRRARRRIREVVGDLLLWVAAAGGVVCIASVIAALGFHLTLILFKTGSMEPTIPTGSVALVHQVPASEVRVGDIVTVDRPGALPVTHRVVSVEGSGPTRVLTLRGDANPVDDPAPYVVDSVRVVRAWIPGGAQVVAAFSNPVVLGALTVGATALVTWAFWPRDDAHGRRRAHPASRRSRAGSASGVAVGVVAGALALVVAAPAPPARANEVETVVHSTYLTLTSIGDPDLLGDLRPAVPALWQVGVGAATPEPGVVHVGLAASGALAAAGRMTLAIDACPVRWTSAGCGPGASTWLPTTDIAAATTTSSAPVAHEIGSIPSNSAVWLRISAVLASGAAPGDSLQLQLRAWGADTGSISPGALGTTGSRLPSVGAPMALAALAVGAGLAIAAQARRRRPDPRGRAHA
ncbi:MAG: signal peptidase I [Actinomycetales bacterium]|nr:signal peptidase I [Actinomycetales bacterium]